MATGNTPMMQQYAQIKAAYPGYLLFYRMGDFFELFGDDALAASDILQITLTRRRSSKEGDEGVPMCGVPHHAAEGYIAKLLAAGQKVALCEQTESPEEAKKRGGSKALVKREVTRLFTGGTLTEDSMLEASRNNYLLALTSGRGELGAAWLDLSTGEFAVQALTAANLPALLTRLSPAEIVLPHPLAAELETALAAFKNVLTPLAETPSAAESESLLAQENAATSLPHKAQTLAAGLLLSYVQTTQLGAMPALQEPQIEHGQTTLQLDAASCRNLEILTTLKGSAKGSLHHAVDRTVTAPGRRLLAQWLSAPLAELKPLQARQTAVATFVQESRSRGDIRSALKATADLSRALSRLTLGRGSPRDLGALSQTLSELPAIQQSLAPLVTLTKGGLLKELSAKLGGFEKLASTLRNALELENLPQLARDGGFIQSSYCQELAEARDLATNGRQRISALEQQEVKATGISTLKVKFNKVWGYYLEVSKGQVDKVPERYVHRQTTTNSQRFSIPELMELERALGAATANALAREQEIFAELVEDVCKQAPKLLAAASALAELDVLCAGAALAAQENYTQPKLTNDTIFTIKAGRHPVVAPLVENFIANDCTLSGGQLWLLTGPNMAGKSTFLRQQALITILAQIGYFVPAKEAEIGLVDKIFTRIGAADDLAAGQSTFMVEMVEAAGILTGATERSLVILDEMGRGTSTYDGLAIAWACVETLANTKCRGLFATHYHELTTLADQLDNVSNYHAAVKEWQGDIVFLHQIKAGAAPGSYGVHVAELAGVPTPVISRAKQILQGLEQAAKGKKAASAADLPLFIQPPQSAPLAEIKPSAVEAKLTQTNVDDLTPREAQALIYQLKELLNVNS